MSVRLSVCLSHSGIVSKRTKTSVIISSPTESRKIIVLQISGSFRARALNESGVSTNWRFSIFKPSYLRNGALEIGPKMLLITNRKSHTRFRLVPKSTTLVFDTELTLNGHYAHVTLQACTSFGAHYKNLNEMKIDLYYQRQKCSLWSPVSSKIGFMGIFTRVAGGSGGARR